MDDQQILARIHALVDEEHALRSDEPSEDEPERLRKLEEMLDQCWDLLRQRRARRQYGDDAEAAEARSIDTVEHYQQ
jgi:hypothetical protein